MPSPMWLPGRCNQTESSRPGQITVNQKVVEGQIGIERLGGQGAGGNTHGTRTDRHRKIKLEPGLATDRT